MKIVTVVGARPQFVKAAIVSEQLLADGACTEVLVHTGQHYDDDMSQVFFTQLGIPEPAYHLGVGSGSHAAQTAAMLTRLEPVIVDEAPDAVMVYGDTNSTLAAALTAAKVHVPVVHVEAGLRSFNRYMPEEINRILTDQLADVLFAPTVAAAEHLAREGTDPSRVHVVGDVMLDASLRFAELAKAKSRVLRDNGLERERFVLVTIHRAENTDDPVRLNAICDALVRIAGEIDVVIPLHPRTRLALENLGRLNELTESARLLAPQGYLDMVALVRDAALVMTDSGGVQKEAFFFRRPCVTVRTETEWTELIDAGWNRLADPTDAQSIASAALSAIGSQGDEIEPYGRGDASRRIVAVLKERYDQDA
jgi:UDP-GlcNAc3NAcA epimerase